MDRRALPGLAVGAAGAVLAAVGALIANSTLAAAAGITALAAGVATAVVAGRLGRTERQLSETDAALRLAQHLAAEREADAVRSADALARAEEALSAADEIQRSRGPETVFDDETGLLDERVFVVSFERKVAAARRHLRPLCLVLVDLLDGVPTDVDARNQALARFGAVVRETLRDADIACRLGPSTFGLILEDTPEAGGVWAAERLQIAVACTGGPPTRMVASVAAYPNHGLDPQEVLGRAHDALNRARRASTTGMGPVEVATSDLS